jgi:hypothetical protein
LALTTEMSDDGNAMRGNQHDDNDPPAVVWSFSHEEHPETAKHQSCKRPALSRLKSLWEARKKQKRDEITTESEPESVSRNDEESTETSIEQIRRHFEQRRQALLKERERATQRLQSIDRALFEEEQKAREMMQNLQYPETDSYGSHESTTSTEQSTPPASPLKKVDHREVKEKRGGIVKEVKNLKFAIGILPLRRQGLYTGTSLYGKIPHGQGTLLFSTGDVYEGPFTYGVIQGANGLYKSASGTKYTGEFYHNLKHGSGEEFFQSGRRYIGHYENGYQHGFGVLYNPSGSVVHLGQWREGKPFKKSAEKVAKESDALSREDNGNRCERRPPPSFSELSNRCKRRPPPSFSELSVNSRWSIPSEDIPLASNIPRSADDLETCSRSSAGSTSIDGQVSFYDQGILGSFLQSSKSGFTVASNIPKDVESVEYSRSSAENSTINGQVSMYDTRR